VATAGTRKDWLRRCLRSLRSQTLRELQIVCVSLLRIEDVEGDPAISFIYEPRKGASNARNVGWRSAEFPIVAFIDDDCIADPRWASTVLRRFSARGQRLGCVTGRVLPTRSGAYVVLPDTYGGPRTFSSISLPAPPWKIGGGLNMAFRKEALVQTGGFDIRLGPGSRFKAAEDLDLFHRMITNGYEIDYDPSALVYHEPMDRLQEVVYKRFAYRVGLGALFAKYPEVAGLQGIFWPFALKEARNALSAALRLDGQSFLTSVAGLPGLLLGRLFASIAYTVHPGRVATP